TAAEPDQHGPPLRRPRRRLVRWRGRELLKVLAQGSPVCLGGGAIEPTVDHPGEKGFRPFLLSIGVKQFRIEPLQALVVRSPQQELFDESDGIRRQLAPDLRINPAYLKSLLRTKLVHAGKD